ncbi:MAG: hypothetical protein AAFN74_13580 [Myxococcota bacterium]
MPKSRIGGKRFNPAESAADVHAKERAQEAGKTRRVERIDDHERLDPDDLPFPEVQHGISTQKTGLQSVIEVGLTRLASAEGFEAQDNALGVLVKAMANAAAPDGAPEPRGADVVLKSELRQALSVAPSQASPVELRRDATQLLALATAALGTEGLPVGRKAEAIITEDIRVIKDALADVLKGADARTVERLQQTEEGLSWAADVMHRGQSALEKADINAATRMDALAGVLRIVLKYARQE